MKPNNQGIYGNVVFRSSTQPTNADSTGSLISLIVIIILGLLLIIFRAPIAHWTMEQQYKTFGIKISEKTVGKSLLQIVQIQKFEKHIMRWRFIFYNPGGKWVLSTFNFDDKIQSLFEE
jgi:hypothetical protein